MNEIEHEGKTYILKSQVESIIKDRVSKVAQRASEAESQVSDLSKQIDSFKSKQASLDMLTEQIDKLKSDLKVSETKFTRYQSMTKLGISEPDLIEAIEWQYDRSMNGKSQKEIVPINEWLENQIQNVDEAPITIRPHLQKIASQSEVPDNDSQLANDSQALERIAEYDQQVNVASEAVQSLPPQTNRGAVPPPEGKDILRRAMQDPDFYSNNVEAVQKAWNARYGR